jgi:hypothetical protein
MSTNGKRLRNGTPDALDEHGLPAGKPFVTIPE